MRYEKHPTIFTTNKSFSHWVKYLEIAFLQMQCWVEFYILHHSKVFQIIGPSYRMKGKEELFKEE